jgi:biopolymer transport protein ExbD
VKLTRTVSFNPAYFTVVPLVNVLFLLLIFFALSSQFVLQPGIVVALPSSPFLLAPQRNPQIVSIVAGPTPAIYFREQKIALDELEARLSAGAGTDKTLIIRADRTVPYDMILNVMNQGLRKGYSVVLATSGEDHDG